MESGLDVPERVKEARRKIVERQRELYVELYASLFSEEELAAELGFYESEIGKTIVGKRRLMVEELKRRAPMAFADLEDELNAGREGRIDVFLGTERKPPPSNDR